MGVAIEYRVEVFGEGEQYVGLCPELNVSSFGDSEDEAEASLREAVALFIEQCREMGTLSEVLEEAGFRRAGAPEALGDAAAGQALHGRAIDMASRKIVPVHYRKLVQVFQLDGFAVARRRGDHVAMTRPGVTRPLIIKTSPRRVPVTHIRTNMTTAGMSRERYFELLDRVG